MPVEALQHNYLTHAWCKILGSRGELAEWRTHFQSKGIKFNFLRTQCQPSTTHARVSSVYRLPVYHLYSKILISDPCSSIASSFILNSSEAEFCDYKRMKDEVFYVLCLPHQLSSSNQYTLDWFQHLSFLLPIPMYSNRTNLSLLEKEVKHPHSGRSVCSSYLGRVIVAVVYLKFISPLVWRRGSRRHRPGTNLKCFIASCHSPPWGGSCKQTLRTGSSCFSHTHTVSG